MSVSAFLRRFQDRLYKASDKKEKVEFISGGCKNDKRGPFYIFP